MPKELFMLAVKGIIRGNTVVLDAAAVREYQGKTALVTIIDDVAISEKTIGVNLDTDRKRKKCGYLSKGTEEWRSGITKSLLTPQFLSIIWKNIRFILMLQKHFLRAV